MPKFWKKQKCLDFRPKLPLLNFFGLEFLKNYHDIWNQHPQICLIVKFCRKPKIVKFWNKNAFFGNFWTRILKNYCRIWNCHPQICQNAGFCKKPKLPKLGTKNTLFVYFCPRIFKNYSHIWNNHPQICRIVKFWKKQKYLNLGIQMLYWVFLTKNALFGYFRSRIFKRTNFLFQISTLKFVKLQNFAKRKNLRFVTKIALFRYFWARNLNNCCNIEISTLKLSNCKVLQKNKIA